MGPQNGGYETLAWNAEHGGDLKTAAHWYREAATYARMRNQPESQLMALSNLAEMYARNGNYKEAVETATYLLTRARDEQLIEYEMRATGRLVEALLAIAGTVGHSAPL